MVFPFVPILRPDPNLLESASMRRLRPLFPMTVLALLAISPPPVPAAHAPLDVAMQQEMNAAMAEFESWEQQETGAFAGYLDAQWKEFSTYVEKSPYRKPKPEAAPMAPPAPVSPEKTPPRPPVPQEPVVPGLSLPTPPVEPPGIPHPEAPDGFRIPDSGSEPIFGISVRLPETIRIPALRLPATRTRIKAFSAALSDSTLKGLQSELTRLKKRHLLDDWGTLLLCDRLLAQKRIAPPRRTLVLWRVAAAHGLDVRIAIADGHPRLLGATTTLLYETPYVESGRIRYHVLFPEGSPTPIRHLSTPEFPLPGKRRPLTLAGGTPPRLPERAGVRAITNRNGNGEALATFRWNRNLTDYYFAQPQTRLAVHLTQQPSPLLLRSMRTALSHLPEDPVRRVGLLLRMVQQVPYAVDDKQFAREYSMRPEELLAWPAADCEDRVAFFGTLVRQLSGLDVIALRYPGHLSAAVAFPGSVSGDAIRYGNRLYVVCDPTYIGAGIGEAMPRYRRQKPEEILPLASPPAF